MIESRNPFALDEFDPDASRLFQVLIVDTPPADRPEALQVLCARHPDLASQLESLYTCWQVAAKLLDSGGINKAAEAAAHSLGIDSRDLEERFETSAIVGRGGMGVVQSAYDRRLRRQVAIKRPTFAPTTAHVLRFLREGLVAARLDHPAIVPIHDLGTDSAGRPWLSMKLVRGEELSVAIATLHDETAGRSTDRRHSTAIGPTITRLVSRLLRVCEAVSYAHAQGVIHRDLKPANIMTGEFGEVFVMDWGLAAIAGEVTTEAGATAGTESTKAAAPPNAWQPDLAHDLVATRTGEILGTLHYMAPEQAQQEPPTPCPALDIFGCGAVLHEILTGHPPHSDVTDARELLEHLRAGIRTPAPAPSPTCSAELIAISQRAMAPAAGDRYPTMDGLIEDLRAWLEGRVVSAYDTSSRAHLRKWLTRHPARAALVATLILSLPLISWLATHALFTADEVMAARAAAQSDAFEGHLAEGFAWSPTDRDRGTAIAAFDRALALRPRSTIAAVGKSRVLGQRSAAREFLERWLGDATPSVGVRLWLDGTPALRPEVREEIIAKATNDVDAYVIGLALIAAKDRDAIADARRMFLFAALSAPRPRIIYQAALLQMDRLLGDRTAMRAHAATLRANWPDHPVSMRTRAIAHAEVGDLARARELIDAAIARRPGWVDGLRTSAWIALQLGDKELGLRALARAQSIGPPTAPLLYLRARLVALDKDFSTALRIAKEGLSLDPTSPAGYFHIGNYQLESGDTRRALASFDAALTRWPEPADDLVFNGIGDMRPRIHTNRAIARMAMGRLAAARSDLERAMQFPTRPWQAGYQFALLELGMGNDTAARTHLADARARTPDEPLVTEMTAWLESADQPTAGQFAPPERFATALVRIGRVAYFSRRLDAAEPLLVTATRIAPMLPLAWHWLAATRMRRGAHAEALEPLRTALDLQPDSADDGTNLGIALANLKRFDAARQALRDVIAAHPKFARAHLWLGIADCWQDRFDDALPHLQRAHALAPADAFVVEYNVRCLITVGRFETALDLATGARDRSTTLANYAKVLEGLAREFRGTTAELETAARAHAKKHEWHASIQLFERVMAADDAKRVQWAVPAARIALSAADCALAPERERLHLTTIANLRHRIDAMARRTESEPSQQAHWHRELATYLAKQKFPIGTSPLPTEPTLAAAWREFETLVRSRLPQIEPSESGSGSRGTKR